MKPRRGVPSLAGALLAAAMFIRRAGRPRPEEVAPDPRERETPASRRSERAVIAMMLASALSGFGFVAVYVVVPSNIQALGACLGMAFVFAAIGAASAGKLVVPQEIEVEPRAQLVDEEEEQEVERLVHESGDGITRRRALGAAAGLAGAGITGALVAPVASFGPDVGELIDHTAWHRGRYVVTEDDKRVHADDIEVGSWMTAFPERADKESLGSPIVLVRLAPRDLRMPPDRRDWTPHGIVAYSKVCTHAGCAIGMFRYPLSPSTTRQKAALVCPCHYSTFDAGEAAKVEFGPAARPLPQLPLMLDAAGYLVAAGPYSGPPGPAWFSVRSGPGPSRR